MIWGVANVLLDGGGEYVEKSRNKVRIDNMVFGVFLGLTIKDRSET